jgi:hypothetical protein
MNEKHPSEYDERYVVESNEVADKLIENINLALTEEETRQRYADVYEAFKAELITLRTYRDLQDMLEHKLFFIELERKQNLKSINQADPRSTRKISSVVLRLLGRKQP